MITPINIDLSGIIEEFSLIGSQAEILGSSIIDRIVEEYSSKWEDATRSLNQSRAEYISAMYIERSSPLEVVFGLSAKASKLALKVEEGSEPYDEKIGFSQSSKAKQKKDGGWYLTIPFRHATPTAVAESGIFASILPQTIYDIAKKKGKVSQTDLPTQYSNPGVRKEIKTPELVVPEYIHKAPQYANLVKVDVSTGNSTRSQYMTFRRVSDKSDPISWWNGGIQPPKKLMDKALEAAQIDVVAQMAIDKFLNDL